MNSQSSRQRTSHERPRSSGTRSRHNLVLYILLVIIALVFIIAPPARGLEEQDAGPADPVIHSSGPVRSPVLLLFPDSPGPVIRFVLLSPPRGVHP